MVEFIIREEYKSIEHHILEASCNFAGHSP